MDGAESLSRIPGLLDRYPYRELFPFAYHQGNDDIACWSKGDGEKVTVIHDFASAGWELTAELQTTGDWLRYVVRDFIDWEPIPEAMPETGS